MYSQKYVDYLNEKRIESAFYNPKSKPKDKPIIELLKPIVYGVGNDFNYYRIGENINIG